MKKILFQGDSITDAGRSRENLADLGTGYPNLVAAKLGRKYPNEYEFVNRAISGNKVTDLIGRWKRDCINIKPDYISILIGVNDVWHELGSKDGTDNIEFEAVYDILLAETKRLLPDTKIFIIEPYILEKGWKPEEQEAFKNMVAEKREIAKKLAKKYDLPTIPLQDIFDEALNEADSLWWTHEGVHPTPAGHQVISDAWIEMFEKIK